MRAVLLISGLTAGAKISYGFADPYRQLQRQVLSARSLAIASRCGPLTFDEYVIISPFPLVVLLGAITARFFSAACRASIRPIHRSSATMEVRRRAQCSAGGAYSVSATRLDSPRSFAILSPREGARKRNGWPGQRTLVYGKRETHYGGTFQDRHQALGARRVAHAGPAQF